MKKYLFIVLLVGVWSCEDKDEDTNLSIRWETHYLPYTHPDYKRFSCDSLFTNNKAELLLMLSNDIDFYASTGLIGDNQFIENFYIEVGNDTTLNNVPNGGYRLRVISDSIIQSNGFTFIDYYLSFEGGEFGHTIRCDN